jgi:tRNA pseudouridine38-40 synthase
MIDPTDRTYPVEPISGMRVSFKVAYVGSTFSGWQFQPDQRTVQGVLNKKLSFLMGREISIVGAGRTDTGVHARGQVAHVTLINEEEVVRLERALPQLMPSDVSVFGFQRVAPHFHSRFSAIARRYSYHLLFRRDIFQPNNWQMLRRIDRMAMDQAAAFFPGTHDCASFCKTSSLKDKGNVCHIDLCTFEWSEDSAIFHVRANRFLHHMVRIMVGTLMEVGRGQRPASQIPEILEAVDRSSAGCMAPAEGLFLEEVYYPEGEGS